MKRYSVKCIDGRFFIFDIIEKRAMRFNYRLQDEAIEARNEWQSYYDTLLNGTVFPVEWLGDSGWANVTKRE